MVTQSENSLHSENNRCATPVAFPSHYHELHGQNSQPRAGDAYLASARAATHYFSIADQNYTCRLEFPIHVGLYCGIILQSLKEARSMKKRKIEKVAQTCASYSRSIEGMEIFLVPTPPDQIFRRHQDPLDIMLGIIHSTNQRARAWWINGTEYVVLPEQADTMQRFREQVQ